MIRAATLLAGLLLVTACFGDAGYSVTVENGTDGTVTFFVDASNATPGSAMADGTRLMPSASSVDHWIEPSGPRDSRRVRVRALGVSGQQVYCHRFGWEELSQLRFHILLTAGVAECS
jgi:hypothetical protein